jgi:cytosine/adenosine deaminase-related metal-dependent hydrolase
MRLETAAGVRTEFPVDYILSGARVAADPWRAEQATLLVRNGRIEAILPGKTLPAGLSKSLRMVDLKDHLILPGLINAHDHLHFGVFPRLGHGPYPSWREWAQDIHRPEEPPLLDLLKIPKETRLWWGAIHNALAGVTTVCHHDAFHALLTSKALPVRVQANDGWAHSLDDPEWTSRYQQTPADQKFIVHFAEGMDAQSYRETERLESNVRLNDRLVLVHAIGVSKLDWLKLRAAGVWIVWCPTSNLHILGHTLARDLLLSYPSIALGSDSPMSATGDLLDELEAARALLDIPPDLLYRMVTTRSARLLRLSEHRGAVAAGGAADLFITRDNGRPPCESLSTMSRSEIAAVMCGGEVTVASDEFLSRLDPATESRLFPLQCHDRRWHVAAPPEVLNMRAGKLHREPLSLLARN